MIQVYKALELKPKYIAARWSPCCTTWPWSTAGTSTVTVITSGRAGCFLYRRDWGFATAIDSLAAVKHLIYDTKKLTWDQLLEAMEKNWEGKEAIRQMCLNAPSTATASSGWTRSATGSSARSWSMLTGIPSRKAEFQPAHHSITFHVPAGMVTMATPNGRPAGEYLSDGIVPSHGCDTKGPR